MGVEESGRRRVPASPPWRVFLSHTAELREEPPDRSFVAAAEAAVILAGHAVTDMAYFAARDHEPAEYCERMVADTDVYVGIVGLRYGSPVRDRPDRSYTEIEYEAATAEGLPRLIFLIREESSSSLSASQLPEYAGRQEAFRGRLLNEAGVTISWVSTPADLEIRVYQALMELRHGSPEPKFPNRLRQLRGSRHTQEEMAALCDVSVSTYRSWEAGERRPRPRAIRALCSAFEVEEHELGYRKGGAVITPHDGVMVSQAVPPDLPLPARIGPPAAIQASQDGWRQVRRHAGAHSGALTRMASGLYPDAMRIGATQLLTREDWVASDPIDLRSLQLNWIEGPQRKSIKGTEAEAHLQLPLRAPGRRYESYTSAVRYLDRPTLFENRPTYRLLEVAMTSSPKTFQFAFGLGTYFEMMDVSQIVSHELAAFDLRSAENVTLDRLPFRSLIGDPFDLRRRPVQAAVNALTLRWDARSSSASFLLHWRDPAKVAIGGGLYSVMPIGVFQPSTVDPWGQREDFDLWRVLVREFSEEFLGMPEHDGNAGSVIDYDMWPLYRTLTRARDGGSLCAFCFGLGVDPLGLGIDILTTIVIDSEVFDDVFGERVQVNEEGNVIAGGPTAAGFSFDEESVRRFLRTDQMGPGGAACLTLAWRHRDALLDSCRSA